LRIFDGTLPLTGLLRVKGGKWDGQPSPARLTALVSTVAFVLSFLPDVLQHPERYRTLDVPHAWVFAIGGTHLSYLTGKAYSLLVRRQ